LLQDLLWKKYKIFFPLFFFNSLSALAQALSWTKYKINLMSASIEAIDPAIVKLPVSKYDMINVVHIDNNRYDSDL
tara:strand:- start:224 stop:451 length:228 start_codon:yes stop_codon:yes gene_type:complete